ncbi:hypothetical protein [Sphingomonas sp. PAMC 26617]|uniref:hypothetical protein n=1 Tax=Sphingomonas sp. PAMC 26617 TaxID=1112216 RepID=UPI000288A0D6|nr:hypothetical protein [Sphingomonas sp. PAMC 26617]
MLSTTDPEPDQPACVLKVGQDTAGHWLVQDSGGRLEGRFISLATAMAFARAERHSLPGATIERSDTPLIPNISFARVEPWENAQHLRHAA